MPNILDYTKLKAINGTSCDSLKSKTIMNVNFKINVKTSKANFSCTAAAPASARLIERVVSVYNGYNYESGVLQLYMWR